MGRAKPLNGTVGVTKPKAQAMRAALDAGDTEKVRAFLDEAVAACELEEYTVLTEDEKE